MSYSKNGFLATGTGGGAAGLSATIVPSSRQIVLDDCSGVATPTGVITSGSITYDGTRAARLLNGGCSYQSANFSFNEFAAIEVMLQRISTLASGDGQIALKRASDNVTLAYIALQADGNIVIYATAATGPGPVAAQGDRYKINFNFNGSSVDAVVRRGSFSDLGGSLALNQTAYASTAITDGTLVYLVITVGQTAQFAMHGLRVFNGPITYGADTLSGAVVQGITYASPSINKPQGALARKYTFDIDTQSFTTDSGAITSSSGRLQFVSGTAGGVNANILEPSTAVAVADGEFVFDFVSGAGETGSLAETGLIFRSTDANNHYLLAVRHGTPTAISAVTGYVELYKKVAGVFTSLGASPTNFSNTYDFEPSRFPVNGTINSRMMVRFVGNLIQSFVDERHVGTWNDSTYTTGRVGIRGYNTNAVAVTQVYDNLSVYTLSSTWVPFDYTPQSAAAAPQYQIPSAGQINYAELTISAAKTITNQAWSLIPFDLVVSDPNALFNTTTSIYTVPATGTYAVGLTFRSDAIAGSNVGLAIHTSNVDSTNTVWRQDYAGTGNRHTFQYYKVAKFNAGDQLRAIAYVDVAGTTLISGATMTLQQVATGTAAAAASALPETVSTASAAATYALPDPAVASISNVTMTANTVFTFPTAGAGKSFTLALIQDATGSRTVTWPGTVKWAGGTAPTLTTTATKTDLLTFVCIDGTNWLGTLAGKAF